jgi:hypothetical protein
MHHKSNADDRDNDQDAKLNEVLYESMFRTLFEKYEKAVEALKAIRKWPDPKPGAGIGIGPLYGAGCYAQYDSDCKKHTEEIDKILEILK